MKILTNTRAAMSGLAVAALALTGVGLSAAPAQAASGSTWDQIANCESSGNWHISTGNGYYGGLQFTLSTWHGFGGSGNPAAASRSAQIAVAERVLASQGWGAWPACSAKLGLRGTSGSTSAAHASTTTRSSTKHTAKRSARHVATRVAVSGRTVTVRPGDTLGRIAAAHGVKGGWQRLADANPQLANPNLIRVGQHLHLPA